LKTWGFGVDIAPLFSDAREIARRAASKEVDVIGVSTHAGGHKALVRALNAALKAEGADDIVLICGGIIPSSDGPALEALGVQAIYGPGTSVSEIAADVLQLLARRGAHASEEPMNDLASAL
jgi:methylmalonyl-CoA mutase